MRTKDTTSVNKTKGRVSVKTKKSTTRRAGPSRKLTPTQVQQILSLYSDPANNAEAIYTQFGISRSTFFRVLKRITY